MKKVLYSLSVLVSLLYIILYCFSVSDIVAKHMDTELFIPIFVIIFSVLLSVAMALVNWKKKLDKKLFVIPLMFFISATVTFVIGYYTPCEFCTL